MSAFGLWMHLFMTVLPKCQAWHPFAQEFGFCLADVLNFTPLNKYSDTKQRAGSHIRSCWLLWHQYKRGSNLCSTISWRLERGHNSQTLQNMQYVNDMCNAMPVYGHAKESAEFAGVWNRGACDFPELFVNGLVHMRLKRRRSSMKSEQLRLL